MNVLKKYLQNLRDNWSANNEYVIFGAGNWFERLYPYAKEWLKIKYIVDNNQAKHGIEIFGAKVFPFEHLLNDPDNPLVLYAVPHTPYLKLADNNIVHESFYRWVQFLQLSMKNRLMVSYTGLVITTKCVLNCKDCTALMPYLKNRFHKKIEALKNEIDVYFSHVDFVVEFLPIGGEPLLHPFLTEIVKYLFQNYSSKIGKIVFTTTGISPIKPEVLECLIEYKDFIRFDISYYGFNKQDISAFTDVLQDSGIEYTAAGFFDKQFGENCGAWKAPGSPLIKRNRPQSKTDEIFKSCAFDTVCRYFSNSKYYPCGVAPYFATINPKLDDGHLLKYKSSKTDYYNIESYQEILTCDLRLQPAPNACNYCDGVSDLNNNTVKPGEQAKKIMA